MARPRKPRPNRTPPVDVDHPVFGVDQTTPDVEQEPVLGIDLTHDPEVVANWVGFDGTVTSSTDDSAPSSADVDEDSDEPVVEPDPEPEPDQAVANGWDALVRRNTRRNARAQQ